MNPRLFFHYLSYLQYPLLLVALFYTLKPYFVGFDTVFANYGNALIFAGLGISMSTLQDTTKMQNKFSQRVWENPTTGKIALVLMGTLALIVILAGMTGLYSSATDSARELSIGSVVFGIGLVGMLKTGIEMFENHRTDRERL